MNTDEPLSLKERLRVLELDIKYLKNEILKLKKENEDLASAIIDVEKYASSITLKKLKDAELI